MPTLTAFWPLIVSLLIRLSVAGMFVAWVWAFSRLAAGRPLLEAADEPRPGPARWTTRTVLVVFLTMLLVTFSVQFTYLTLRGVQKLSSFDKIAVGSLSYAALLIVLTIVLRATDGATLADFGFRAGLMAVAARAGTLGFLLVTPALYVVQYLAAKVWKPTAHELQNMFLAAPTLGTACLALISAVVLAPAAEELVFRGIIQSWLTRVFDRAARDEALEPELDPPPVPAKKRPRSTAPIVITSVVFAVVHFEQWPAPLAIFILSMVLGTVYQSTGSLFASFLMHALFNGFSTLLLFQMALSGHPADLKAAPTVTCAPIAFKLMDADRGRLLLGLPRAP